MPQLFHPALVFVMLIQCYWKSEDHTFTSKVVSLLPDDLLGSPFLHQLSTASYKSTVQPGVLDHHLLKSHLSCILFSRHVGGAFAQRTKVQNGVELDGVAPSTYKYTREPGGGHLGKQNQLS